MVCTASSCCSISVVCSIGSKLGSWGGTVGAIFLGRPRVFFAGMASGTVSSAAACSLSGWSDMVFLRFAFFFDVVAELAGCLEVATGDFLGITTCTFVGERSSVTVGLAISSAVSVCIVVPFATATWTVSCTASWVSSLRYSFRSRIISWIASESIAGFSSLLFVTGLFLGGLGGASSSWPTLLVTSQSMVCMTSPLFRFRAPEVVVGVKPMSQICRTFSGVLILLASTAAVVCRRLLTFLTFSGRTE